jgi:acetyl esterase/lipase
MTVDTYPVVPEPPYRIDEHIVQRFDKEYVDFFNKHVSNQTNLLFTHLVPVPTLRKGGNVMPGQSPLAELKSIVDKQVPRKYTEASTSVPVRIFTPLGDAPANAWPCTIWFHGGGWVLGDISTENSYCSHVADLAKCIVISVDYRLAPEFPFPACIEDSYEAVLWVYEQASSLGIDNTKIAVGGSSAGGNITAVLTHKLGKQTPVDIPPFVYQLLVVPVCDNTADKDTHLSWNEFENTPQLPLNKMMWYRHHYLPDKNDWTNPEASPIFYSPESYKKCPPAFVAVAECDVLRTEGELYAAKLQEAGVDTKLVVYPGVPHPVMAMDAVLTQGKILMNQTTSSLRAAFYGN